MTEEIKRKNKQVIEFEKELNKIEKLISLPNLIREVAINALKSIDLSTLKFEDKSKVDNSIKSIENIKDKSIDDSYKVIYNQSCVLAVSSLSAVLEKYFINYIKSNRGLVKVESKITFRLSDIAPYDFDIKSVIGELITEKDSSINFQIVVGIEEVFKTYFDEIIVFDEKLKSTAIFYQQCRHTIVHKSGIVDKEFIKKVGNSNIKGYVIGNKVELDGEDWGKIKESFVHLINSTIFRKNIKK
jgi:hypothetical protein